MQVQSGGRTCITLVRTDRLTLCSALLFIILTVSFMIPSEVNSSTPYTEIEHLIQITDGGLVLVNDTITLWNNGTESITRFPIGFHNDLSDNLDSIFAQSASGEPLSINENRTDNETDIYWIDIRFPKELGINESFDFSVTFAFSRLISFNTLESVNIAVFPEFPAIVQKVAYCRAIISLSSGIFVNSSWGNSTVHTIRPLPENYNQTGWVTYQGAQHIIECTTVKRDIVLDSWGNSLSFDTYRLRNMGGTNIYVYPFPLPNNVKNVIAYDDLGSLTTSLIDANGQNSVHVTFRYPLRGVSSTSQNRDAYRFTIHYTINTQDHLTHQSPFSPLHLSIEILPSPDFTLKNVHTQITFPEGATFLQASPTPSTTSESFLTQSISYINKNVAPFTRNQLSITYDYNIFWAAFRPTLWMGAILVVISGIVIINRRKKPKPKPVPDKNIGIVRTLIEACGERIGLWNELETLENDFDNRRIRRKDFNRRRRIFIQRLSSVNKEITSLSKSLHKLGAPYPSLLKKLDTAEAAIRSSRTEINRLRNQRQRGQLSNNDYRQRREEYDRQIQKAKVIVGEVIFELKRLTR